ncbi:MAG: AgmX/PglI C-terminal domain-containing protein [Deltaproteobacteria bacterium]|nr:AgmX/PglI C-terminal domain-containing protein [Deltaproteobacteria bacterium]
MTPHAPKTAALEALAADLLSDEGTRRIRAHLRGCDVCREHFATIHVYRESQEFITRAEPEVGGKPIDWSKMELALAREARVQATANAAARGASANDGRYPWLLGGAIAVAAAALVAIGVSNGWWMPPSAAERAPVVATNDHTTEDEPPVVAAVRLHASGTVSMIAGAAMFTSDFADSAAEDLAIGQRVAQGTVMTGPLGRAAFELERPATTTDAAPVALAHVTLGADAQLGLGEVAALDTASDGDPSHEITARLAHGRTTIDAFEASSRVIVLAGSYRVEIRAARCTIDLNVGDARDDADDTTRVVVGARHGETAEVVVVDPSGVRTTLTTEPWNSRALEAAPELAELPIALTEGPIVQVDFPEAVRFEIDGVSYDATGPTLALRVPVGALDLRAFDRTGRAFRARVDVGPDGLALSPDQLEPIRPHVVGFLPPEDITPIVQRSQRGLQRCYEAAMRMHPEISGSSMRARVTLDSRGAVRVVEIEGESVPPSLELCVRQEAAHWTFPPPGGPMTFDLPLRFRTRQ